MEGKERKIDIRKEVEQNGGKERDRQKEGGREGKRRKLNRK